MTQARQSLCRSTLFMLVLLFAIALVSPGLGSATDLPIYGGLGGNTDREDCPKGWYLVGLAGKTGSWVDRIAPICAPWLRGSQAFGAPSVRRSFGWSTGGNDHEKRCTDVGRNLAIQSWWIRLLRSDNHYVQSIDMYCDSLPTPFPPTKWGPHLEFGTFSLPPDADKIVGASGPFPSQPPFQACPAGEVATGIRVRAGKYVDAIGLICGPVPPRVGAPSTKVDPRIMMPRTDLFEIIKPFTDTTIPHGRLIILAEPPKVGDTGVADIELRYLDAPANQRHSYPFKTDFSVTKAQLLDGYPVSERVTGGYIGRWQIRVRSGMKTPPGDWSSVQFNMVKAPVPPPMVEMPRQNVPITVQPALNSGTAPMMVRPPMTSSGGAAGSFMVRPRGVEAGKEQDPTAATEKKP